MIARMVYVICDRCGAPASEPVEDAKEARRLVPRDWQRLYNPRTRRKQDWCPYCLAITPASERGLPG